VKTQQIIKDALRGQS